MTREIPLSLGHVALVDEEDWAFLSQYRWRARKGGNRAGWYAVTSTYDDAGQHTVSMHRLLLDAPRDMQVDHINGDGLDNRRDNIRLCTQSQNQANQRLPKSNKSGYKGVYRFGDKWRALIGFRGRRLSLGVHKTAEEAARAYDEKARELFGEFARPNLPDAA